MTPVRVWQAATGLWAAQCAECPPGAAGGRCEGWREQARAEAWARWHELEHDRMRPEVVALVEELLAWRDAG